MTLWLLLAAFLQAEVMTWWAAWSVSQHDSVFWAGPGFVCLAARKPKLLQLSELMETRCRHLGSQERVCCLFQREACASRPTHSRVGSASRSPRPADGAQMRWVQSLKMTPKCFIVWVKSYLEDCWTEGVVRTVSGLGRLELHKNSEQTQLVSIVQVSNKHRE